MTEAFDELLNFVVTLLVDFMGYESSGSVSG